MFPEKEINNYILQRISGKKLKGAATSTTYSTFAKAAKACASSTGELIITISYISVMVFPVSRHRYYPSSKAIFTGESLQFILHN